jgi:cyclophilin family peptidyl-prolyl cis-trans isomerase
MCPNKKRSFNRAPRKKKSNSAIFIAVALVALIAVVSVVYVFVLAPKAPADMTGSTQVLLQTSMGNITIQLRTDKPITSENFRSIVEAGKYDGTVFHRIIAGFMIQGGQITGSVSQIHDEIGSNNRNVAYTIAMAKTVQANSATSQFFINVADNGNKVIDTQGTKFDAAYTVFGNVISGQDVVDKIAAVPCVDNPQTGEQNSLPTVTVTVLKASMLP